MFICSIAGFCLGGLALLGGVFGLRLCLRLAGGRTAADPVTSKQISPVTTS